MVGFDLDRDEGGISVDIYEICWCDGSAWPATDGEGYGDWGLGVSVWVICACD